MEIGSIFEIDPRSLYNEQKEGYGHYPFERGDSYNRLSFNTGRAAIETLLSYLKARGKKQVWMPSFNCSSVYDAAVRSGMSIEFYPIKQDLSVDLDFLSKKTIDGCIFYALQLFGKRWSSDLVAFLSDIKKKGAIIVEDITLSLLSEKNEFFAIGDYLIASIRKWLPIPDGGFVASKTCVNNLFEFHNEIPASNDYTYYYFAAQIMKDAYLRDKSLDKSVFLNLAKIGMDALFSDYTIRRISRISEQIERATDMEEVARRRKSNYLNLYRLLIQNKQIVLPIAPSHDMVPLGMLILSNERDALFAHLINNGVYCNIHWRPNDCTSAFEGSRYLSEHALTIPCDQRYGDGEMQFISEIVSSFYKA